MKTDEKLITHTWLPVFPGFYETLFNGDLMYDNEIQYIEENITPKELADVLVDKFYETKAFDKLYEEYEQCDFILEKIEEFTEENEKYLIYRIKEEENKYNVE